MNWEKRSKIANDLSGLLYPSQKSFALIRIKNSQNVDIVGDAGADLMKQRGATPTAPAGCRQATLQKIALMRSTD